MQSWLMVTLLAGALHTGPGAPAGPPARSLLERPAARFPLSPPKGGELRPQPLRLRADSTEDTDTPVFVGLGAVVGALAAWPIADRVTADARRDCYTPICAVPGVLIVAVGAGLGAVGGLIVHKIVHHSKYPAPPYSRTLGGAPAGRRGGVAGRSAGGRSP